MPIERTIRILLSLALALCAVRSRPAVAGQIVGITFGSGLYNVDPSTGSTTLLRPRCVPGCGPYLGGSGSPHANSIFLESVVNIWEANLTTLLQSPVGGISHPFDLAFDRGTNTLYDTSGSALFTVDCPSPPALCTETQVGPAFPTSHIQALGFVPGAGLYGVSDNFLYLINDSTGATTPVGATGLPDPTNGITDLAYDAGTGRLIASAGCSKFDPFTMFSGPCDESHPGSIYLIDRATGHALLLNGNAPMIVGLAEVVPEPGSAFLLAAGVGALLVWSFRRRASARRFSVSQPTSAFPPECPRNASVGPTQARRRAGEGHVAMRPPGSFRPRAPS